MIWCQELLYFLRQTQCLLKTNRILALSFLIQCKINIYYIFTPMKNQVIFCAETWYQPSHVKITHNHYLHMWKYHCCSYDYIQKNLLKWNGLVVHWCLYNRTLHGPLEIENFSSRVEKIFHSFAALTHEIFFDTRREISYLHAAM